MPATGGNSTKAYLDGAWKDWAAVQGNLDGTWRLASDVFVNDRGTWKQVWVRLTAPTNGSASINHVTATVSWTAGVGHDGFKLYRNGVFLGNVSASTTTITDIVPTMQTNYTYTVSAYAGDTETAQITCGTVSAQVGTASSSATILRDWSYAGYDTWDNQQILFTITTALVSNASGYQYSFDNGASIAATTLSASAVMGMNQDAVHDVVWRAYVNHNGATYYGAWSAKKTVSAGRPRIRTTQTDDTQFDAWLDKEFYYTVFGAFEQFVPAYTAQGDIVEYYQFRNLNATFSSQITSPTRSIELVKPGTNPLLTGTPYIDDGYNSPQYTDYSDQRYGVNPYGSGWYSYNSANKLTGYIRFKIWRVTQTAVGYTIA